MKILIYDAEIENAIPTRAETPIAGIQYCQGWTDFVGMGVSVICAYVWDEGYRVFLKDNLLAFKELAEAPDTLCIGFNNRSFDDRLLAAHGVQVPDRRSWDLLRAIRIARGQSPAGVSGPNLHQLCQANFLPGKSGSGAFAPLLWQKGKIGQVIDYALNDVQQTKQLVELVRAGRLRDPDNGKILPVTMPTSLAAPVEVL